MHFERTGWLLQWGRDQLIAEMSASCSDPCRELIGFNGAAIS